MAQETFQQLGKMISYFIWLREDNEASEKRIEKLTDYDRITGLYNMERFKREADRLLTGNHSRKYAVAYCDLSNFAYINESYGYEKGDALLYSFARVVVRENSKCLVASRMFSDCFSLLLEYETKNDLLERFQDRIERFEQEQKEFYPNADIHVVAGIYLCAEGVGITEAMDNANIARKSIKGNRKAVCQIYRPEQWVSGKNEFIALGTLQAAMEQHHLVVYLQPKVSLQNGKVTGAEALIRWFNPDGTMKYPDEFIPGLERTGSIVDLDFYVYEQVLIQLRKWLDEGKPAVPLSVNLSRKHGYYADFAERILDLTLKYQIPHELIEFEVTEGAFMETEENLVTRLETLRNAGFRISMDDFGVGYSSLSMLINAPIDSVKIDKSFLYHSETESKRRSLIKYIIDMAHTLQKEIICEGVETAVQAEFLRKCSCETAQGYLFSKPITMENFEELYLKGRKNGDREEISCEKAAGAGRNPVQDDGAGVSVRKTDRPHQKE